MTDERATARQGIRDLLGAAPGRARFAEELLGALQRRGLDREMTEDALDGLAHEDEIVIRRNYCADSHLDGADLRVVASVAAAGEPAARCAADEAAQRLWSSWLAGYLSEHRCT